MKKYKQHRITEWVEYWLPQFKDVTNVKLRENGSYTMECVKYGIVDYYPGSDRVLIREPNDWKHKGLSFLAKQFDIPYN